MKGPLAAGLSFAAWLAGAGGAGAAPFVAGHRGAGGLWPENSLRAFRGALELGVDLLELDVHLSRDGELVVMHDPRVDRTTTGRGAIAQLPFAEIRRLRVRPGPDGDPIDEPPPTLAEVLALAGERAGLLVEIKRGEAGRYDGIEPKVAAALDAAGAAGRAVVMSFDLDHLRGMKRVAPALRTSALLSARQVARGGETVAAFLDRAVEVGAAQVGLEHALITPEVVAAARARGLTVGAWTVDDPAAARRLAEAGVEVVTTDRPDLILPALGRARR
jgi:glycerophosphoryl diester phosphodiesterase